MVLVYVLVILVHLELGLLSIQIPPDYRERRASLNQQMVPLDKKEQSLLLNKEIMTSYYKI